MMSTNIFAPMFSGGVAVFAQMVINTYQLQAVSPSYINRTTTSGPLRLSLTFADTPAPRERTIVLGGSSTSITS